MNKDATESLKGGEIGIFPTDTAYGIGCRIDNINSVRKIYKLRNRPEEKALLALVSSLDMAREYVTITEDVQKRLINKYWPGGLTIILNCNIEKVPGIVRANGETLAVRWPEHSQLCEIIEEVGVPIVAPSANFSGQSTPFSIDEVDRTLLKAVDFIIEGVCTMRGVSTIINATVNPWRIVRQGVVQINS